MRLLAPTSVTQSSYLPAAIAVRLPPNGTVWVIVPVRGSIRLTSPPTVFASHTEPPATAISAGWPETGIRSTTESDEVLTRETSAESGSATHNESPAAAIAPGAP